MAQKVISVNINTDPDDKLNSNYQEIELELVNKYLADGYTVYDKFSTVSNSDTSRSINITFILNKGIKP